MFYSINKILKSRLTDAILSLRNDMKNFDEEKHNEWLTLARNALTVAEESLQASNATEAVVNSGWVCFHSAEQYLVKCMDEEMRRVKLRSIVRETSKLSGWRKDLIYSLAGSPELIETCSISPALLIETMKIRDDYYYTHNHKMALHKSNLNRLTLALWINIIFIIGMSFTIDLGNPVNLGSSLLASALFGTLGACFSMSNTHSSSTLGLRIPEQLLGMAATFIRLAIGATAAIILFLLLSTEISRKIFSQDLFDSGYAYLVFSFIAGFSERWVVKILESVAKEPDKK